VALYGGLALTLAGALLLHDAWEARGRVRPWLMRVVGIVE
jgi:hypothetical protein